MFQTAGEIGVTLQCYMRLVMLGAPPVLFDMLKFVFLHMSSTDADLDLVEFFCGIGVHTRTYLSAGLSAVGYDILRDGKFMNMCSDLGMLVAITLAKRLGARAVVWLATVCSSWSWMSLHSTGRNVDVLGSEYALSVVQGNLMTCRSGLLIFLTIALDCT